MDTIWFGNEPVAVEAHVHADGRIQPIGFTWRGKKRKVTALGRQWVDTQGRHLLVVVSDGSRFELCLTSVGNSWRLLRVWERPYLA